MCLDRSLTREAGLGLVATYSCIRNKLCHVTNVGAPPAGLERGGAPRTCSVLPRTRSTSVLNSGCPARGQNGDWGFTPSVLLAGHPHAVSHLQTGALQPCTQEPGGPVTESQLHPLVGGLLKSPGLDFVK